MAASLNPPPPRIQSVVMTLQFSWTQWWDSCREPPFPVDYLHTKDRVPVAQLDSASASGAEGYRFESCRGYCYNERSYDDSVDPLRSKLRSK